MHGCPSHLPKLFSFTGTGSLVMKEWTDAAQKVLVPTAEKIIEEWEKELLTEYTEDKHNNSDVNEFKREMKSFNCYIKAMMTFVKILADPTIGGPEMFY